MPADCAVMISPYVVHRTATCFEVPEEFRPTRWADLRPAVGEYLPFGGGSRWCVGNPLAEMELATIIVGLAGQMRFSIQHLGGRPNVRTTMVPDQLILRVERS